jgi:hypothetical protein
MKSHRPSPPTGIVRVISYCFGAIVASCCDIAEWLEQADNSPREATAVAAVRARSQVMEKPFAETECDRFRRLW